MDDTLFAHLHPKRRAQDYAAKVAQFIEKCPVDEVNFGKAYLNQSPPYSDEQMGEWLAKQKKT